MIQSMLTGVKREAPIQIAARGIELNSWWRDKIFRRAAKLAEFHRRITHCRIVVEVPHKHHHKRRLYTVRVDIEVPGRMIIINREPAPTLNEAVDKAFDAAERRLEDRVRVMRGMVKHHEPPETTATNLFRASD